MEIDALRKQINNLQKEIEQDKSEISLAPVRFQDSISKSIQLKQNQLIEFGEQLNKLKEIVRTERLNRMLPDFENHINLFFENYKFEEENDLFYFQSRIFIDFEDNKLTVSLTDEDENLIRRKANKEKLRITFPNGNSIEEFKPTDSFAKAIVAIGVSKIEGLDIRILRLPLIGKIKSERYQQREILPETYLVTQTSNEKKVEILELISEKLKLNLNVELI